MTGDSIRPFSQIYEFAPNEKITLQELAQIAAALPVRAQQVTPATLRQHFQVVEVSTTEAGKAVPEIAGGLRGGVR